MMDTFSETVRDMPLASMIPIVLAIVIGLMLWVAGRRVLRAGFAALGLLLGAGVGWIIGTEINLGIPVWAIAVVVGMLTACMAALLYRVAIALALGLVLAVTGPALVLTVGEIQGKQPPVPLINDETPNESAESEPDDLERFFEENRDEAIRSELAMSDETAERIREVRSYGERLIASAKNWWAQTPASLRPAMIGAAAAGLVLGILLGTLAAGFSASVISAFGGALLWLAAARIFLTKAGEPIEQWLPETATTSLMIWLVISLFGVAIQWMFRPKRADTTG